MILILTGALSTCITALVTSWPPYHSVSTPDVIVLLSADMLSSRRNDRGMFVCTGMGATTAGSVPARSWATTFPPNKLVHGSKVATKVIRQVERSLGVVPHVGRTSAAPRWDTCALLCPVGARRTDTSHQQNAVTVLCNSDKGWCWKHTITSNHCLCELSPCGSETQHDYRAGALRSGCTAGWSSSWACMRGGGWRARCSDSTRSAAPAQTGRQPRSSLTAARSSRTSTASARPMPQARACQHTQGQHSHLSSVKLLCLGLVESLYLHVCC